MIAIIGQAIWPLGRKAFKSRLLSAVGLVVFLLNLLGLSEAALLVWRGAVRDARAECAPRANGCAGLAAPDANHSITLNELFLTFVKMGAVIYGSGYVLLAFCAPT